MRTVLPGLQFILAGIIGKPVSYYVVPMIRMAFVVINYMYVSCRVTVYVYSLLFVTFDVA